MSDAILVHVSADPIDAAPDSRGYDIHIGEGLLELLADFFPLRGGAPDGFALICDENTDRLFGERAEAALGRMAPVTRIVMPGGEENKNLTTLGMILERMAAAKLTRRCAVAAVGGGIVGDVAGFAAASYLRGVRLMQVPTTLLAAVDSSVGGKTAVNLSAGKNLAGAFHQPSAVVCDTSLFATLTTELIGDGTAEALKHGVLSSRELFRDTAAHGALRPETIAANVTFKASVVAADTRESGARKLLNLGHTFGHAIEKCSGYAVSHGHAVAIGTAMAARAACSLGILAESDRDEITDGIRASGLPTETDIPASELAEVMLSDKKRSGDGIDFILPETVGRCRITRIPTDRLGGVLAAAGVK